MQINTNNYFGSTTIFTNRIRNIVHNDSCRSSPIVHWGQAMVPLLPWCIPYLKPHRLAIHCQCLRKKCGTNHRFLHSINKKATTLMINYMPTTPTFNTNTFKPQHETNLKFNKLPFNKPQNYARFPCSHVSQKNLLTQKFTFLKLKLRK